MRIILVFGKLMNLLLKDFNLFKQLIRALQYDWLNAVRSAIEVPAQRVQLGVVDAKWHTVAKAVNRFTRKQCFVVEILLGADKFVGAVNHKEVVPRAAVRHKSCLKSQDPRHLPTKIQNQIVLLGLLPDGDEL